MTNPKRKAADAGRRGGAGGLRLWHLVVLLALLIPPGLALRKLSAVIDYRWLLGYGIVISLATYALYGADKDSAVDKASKWRASEYLLHAFEFAGGWPGAFLAQQQFRHKCSKVSYQVVFWLIVALEVGVATDYHLGWRFARGIAVIFVHGAAGPGNP